MSLLSPPCSIVRFVRPVNAPFRCKSTKTCHGSVYSVPSVRTHRMRLLLDKHEAAAVNSVVPELYRFTRSNNETFQFEKLERTWRSWSSIATLP